MLSPTSLRVGWLHGGAKGRRRSIIESLDPKGKVFFDVLNVVHPIG
jgi:hypothetical protein